MGRVLVDEVAPTGADEVPTLAFHDATHFTRVEAVQLAHFYTRTGTSMPMVAVSIVRSQPNSLS